MAEKIYRIDMKTLSFKVEEVPTEWLGLGGRALTSEIISLEVEPTAHPLGSKNKMVFCPGLLSGTSASNSGRNSLGAKSPLTNGIKESNVGGTIAQILSKLGIKALIIENIPENDDVFYHLHISKDSVEFNIETELVGKQNFEVLDTMLERYSKKVAVMSIGTTGEMKMLTSNISVKDPSGKIRSHGRGGLGAVMGSKKIKVITVDAASNKEVTIANKEAFKAASKAFTKALLNHPISGEGLPAYGTNVLTNVLNEAGGLPTHNFRFGSCEHAENISGETMAANIEERGGKTTHGCHSGCIIQCSQVYMDKMKNFKTAGFEYETIWAFGANFGIKDLDLIADLDYMMDDFGLDSIEVGVTFAVAAEAGILEWGDGQAVYNLLNDIAKGTPIGRIIGSGAAVLGRLYGLTRVPTVKGQSIPAYDPRAVKGQGITYATTPMGADHTAGYAVASNILGCGTVTDPLKKEGQIELSRNLQIASAAIDSTGMCIFVAFPALDDEKCLPALIDMINARFGTSLTGEDIDNLGKKILKTERAFNIKAGLTSADDRLPEFFSEALPPHNVVWDFTPEEIDSFWDF